MVDIHCHVLPDVDDGPQNVEDSLRILKKAEESGVEIVVATPHLLKGLYEIEFPELVHRIADLQRAVDENGINVLIKPGFECYLSPDICNDTSKLAELTINNNGKYILVELPMQSIPLYVENVFSDLLYLGITPIIAHPERNVIISRNPNILFDFVSKGCIAQLNAGSILGLYGRGPKRAAKIFLTHALVHVVASDTHFASLSPMTQALPEIEKLLDSESVLRMFDENPHHIVAGEPICKDTPQRYESTRISLKSIIYLKHKKK